MAQDICIHAGAHRTGTSSFQHMLAQNRTLLHLQAELERHLVAQMRDVLRPETLVVVPYEQRGRSVDLLSCVLGRSIEGLQEPRIRVNQSATDGALQILQTRYHAGERLSRAQWQAVLQEHASGPARSGFARFTADQEAALAARYAQDCAALARMPGVDWKGGRPDGLSRDGSSPGQSRPAL